MYNMWMDGKLEGIKKAIKVGEAPKDQQITELEDDPCKRCAMFVKGQKCSCERKPIKVKFGEPGLRMGHLTIEFPEVQYAPLDDKRRKQN